MVANASGVELISFDPAQSLTSPHNLKWAAARGYTYAEGDGMYRDSEGKLVDTPTRDKSYAPFGETVQAGGFWGR